MRDFYKDRLGQTCVHGAQYHTHLVAEINTGRTPPSAD